MLLNVTVGIGFVGVALIVGNGPSAMRWWWSAVGITWWCGDIAVFRLVHQGVLIAALALFPTGRPRGSGQYSALGVGVVAATGVLGQWGAAVGFLGTAAIRLRRAVYSSLAAVVVGLWLAGSFVWSRVWPETFEPSRALVGYEVILLVIALTLPLGLWAEARRRSALGDRVLAAGPAGFAGLEVALRRALRRPALALTRDGDTIVVEGLGRVDSETVASVDRVVTLTTAHEHALADAARRLHELETARERLFAAADVERGRAAERLSHEVAALRTCQARLAGLPDLAREVGAAAADVQRIVAGLPPPGLGGGGIRAALVQLCTRHAVQVSLEMDEHAAGDLASETALFFAASEALANSAKHALAHAVVVSLEAGDELVLLVEDDGIGGADSSGSGLVSLRDRLAAVGGSLSVDSGGPGTRLVARVSRTRPPVGHSIRT